MTHLGTLNGLVVSKTDGTYVARTITAGAGISVSNGDGTSGNPTISSDSLLVTTYNTADSPATWTKNAATRFVMVYGQAAGGGGGSGRKGTSTACSGGGAGSGGGAFLITGQASLFGATETVVIGAGGAGAAAQTADGNDGIDGNDGGNTSFGNILCVGGKLGEHGRNGTSSGGLAQIAFSVGYAPTIMSNSNGAGTRTSGVTPGNNPTGGGQLNGCSGGGGGGTDSVTERAGGTGGAIANLAGGSLVVGGALGLESTGINGSNGNPGLLSTGGLLTGGSGGGGGGGYSVGAAGATAGGNGGDGGFPSGGGGGGGGGLDTVANSGGGGDGANGRVIVVEFF